MSKSQSFLERHHFLLRRLHSLTGIMPIGVFLIAHLTTNSTIVWGLLDGRHSEYGHAGGLSTQQPSDPVLLLIDSGCGSRIAFHPVLGAVYAMSGAEPAIYPYQELAVLASGVRHVGLVFIPYHVATLRWGGRPGAGDEVEAHAHRYGGAAGRHRGMTAAGCGVAGASDPAGVPICQRAADTAITWG